ncbi:nucleoporin subcomplex protein binding to Pom34-domain-containing protein [Pseudomassariella vexata]|uniref:Nucleoporin subcomplex protein binding to Pom34-domain-containing protein n=1 Tax=Pseudomassariella vexata TaxID=1141098 RepID=A0A1Y2DWP4_9PEZI|nr:nucleoporin subcomplex protein binding to Pom34-domain-containing protein [Pseudomassariella vexata]ORY63556.1 nucleoporin subcomplex protein binding to Pom34-domain-containing protein [Pseudomassariella vexata]
MAPLLVDKVYLPDLEPCLKGETAILSWRLVALALADNTGHRQSSQTIVDFLTNPQVQTFFTKPSTTFEAPAGDNDPYKQTFETRTSAVQVTPTPNDKYDVAAIKEDSVWLSKNARINLIAALRVVLIEFQSRARSQLTGPVSSQDNSSLQEAAGATNAQASSILPGLNLTSTRDAVEIQTDFDKLESRRRRIFEFYLVERRYFSMTTDYIFTLMLQESLPTSPVTNATTVIRNSFLQAFGLTSATPQSEAPAKTYHALVSQYFTLVTGSINNIGDMGSVAQDQILHDVDLQKEWMKAFLEEAIHEMTVAFQLLDLANQVLAPAELLQQWFQFLGDTSFLNQLEAFEDLSDLIPPVYCLLCAISLTMFNIPRVIQYLEGEIDVDSQVEYIGSSEALELVHEIIMAAVERNISPAIPVAYGWIPILHGMWRSYQNRAEKRDALQNQKAIETYDSGTAMIPGAGRRNSAGSITTIDKSSYDDFLTNTQMEKEIKPAQFLAEAATSEGRVFSIITRIAEWLGTSEHVAFAASVGSRMRLVLLDLLKATYTYVPYNAESVTALISLLSPGHDYWNLSKPNNLLPRQDIVSCTLTDGFTLDTYFHQALNRYPFEFAPFSRLCRILSCATSSGEKLVDIVNLLQKTPTLVFVMPAYHFNQFELIHEDRDDDMFELLEDIPLFPVVSSRKRIPMDEEDPFIVPARTTGVFMNTASADGPRIVRVEWEHSALALLGKRLEATLSPKLYQLALGQLSPDDTSEAISLIGTLIRTETLRASRAAGDAEGSEAGLIILAEVSRALPRNKDIISIVCEILDIYLEGEPGDSSLAVLTACFQFLHAILPLFPGRVWSYMARSAALSNDSSGGRLSRLVGTLELSNAQFDFLLSAVRVFSNLVDSAMSSSVQRKAVTKPSPRQKANENIWLGVSDKIMTQITVSISHAVVDIFESSSTWKFPSEVHRTILIRDLVPVMNNVITYTFGIDDMTKRKTLTTPLEISAKYVIDSFLSPAAGSLRIQPLLATLVAASQCPNTTLYANGRQAIFDQTIAVLGLATTLVRVANFFDRSSTTIELQLFKATPFVARVCAANDAFRKPAISLLEALVVSAGKTTGEPPSLLGYLGPRTSRAFLQLLSTLDRPFDQAEQVGAIWRFFSTIVRNRQQWMANCLLTGKTPRDVREGHDKTSQTSSDSVLTSALGRLSSISSIPTSEALSILDFLTSAQNYWPWTIFNLQKNNEFMSGLRSYVRELKSSSITSKTDVLQASNEARIAAYIAETFAMQLFHLRQMGQAGPLAKDLAQDLDYYLRDGVLVSGYNNSLHANFSRNFSNQYPGCTLENFKRTLLEPRSLGFEYYYALSFADRMLQFDPGWIGPRNNGFKSEMEMANANLSLVDAQIALFHAWEYLLLELSNCLPHNDALKKQSLQVAEQCLEANQSNQGHELIFERLTESRVNLALMLVQRVVNNTPSAGDVAQLLTTLWATVSTVEEPYNKDSILLYRTLLKLLYVTLRAQVSASGRNPKDTAEKLAMNNSAAAVSQTVLSILDRVVAGGFRTLVSLIHDSEAIIFPEDIAILTAIMQACLCIPGISQSQTQIVNIMAAHDAVHVAVSLYSWSDKLADKGDPIYGELSLLFLLELSALPLVAEQLACDGLLNHLTSASMASYLSRPNVTPFADTVGPQRCYSIWAKAIVPLLLNVTTSLGQTIAPEVAYVLNQFPNLMKSSVERFEALGGSRTQSRNKSSYITLLSVSEVHSLALITRVLGVFRSNNTRDVPEVEWDSQGLLENVEFWLSTRKILRERLLPLGPREAEWKAMPPSDIGKAAGCESRLEEKVVEQLEAVRAVLSEDLE